MPGRASASSGLARLAALAALAAVDDQRHWYRCHQLFRQLLRDRLKQRYGPAEIATLQLRASAWFADNGYLDEALQ